MKLFHIFLILSLFLISCNSKTDKKVIVNDFVVALGDADFEKAKALSNTETIKIIELVEKDYNANKDKLKDPKPVVIEILETTETEVTANYKVKIIIGEVTREVVINMILVNEVWLIEMPEDEITILQFVVFHSQYDLIIVVETEVDINVDIKVKTIKKTKKETKKKTNKKH